MGDVKQAVFQIVNTEYELIENIKIDPEYSQLVPELNEEEYRRLKESVSSVGLYEPIIINQEKVLLDGHHRFKVVKDLDWIKVNVETKIFETRIDEKIYVIETNLSRRQLIAAMRIKLSRALYGLTLQKHGEDNQSKAGKIGRNIQLGVSSAEETPDSVDTDKVIAEKSATSKASVYRVKKIMDEGTPEEKTLLFSGEGKINTAFKEFTNRTTPKKPEIETPPLPSGIYDIFYADPPWRYDFSETRTRAIETNYPTMTLEDICELKIPNAENSVLFLWATNPKLEEALEVIKAWGFTYKTNLAWVKDRIGMGYWFRGQHELLLVATKGKIKPPEQSVRRSGVLEAPRREHSQKPDEVYELIESYFPNGKYIELFSRNKREGWTMWGNES